MAAKRIQLIKDFVEKTAKRLLDYPGIAKMLGTDAISFLDKGKEIEKKLLDLLKPEIAYSNKAVKEDYGHIDTNARLYIQCILTTFEKTYGLLQAYSKEYEKLELVHPDLVDVDVLDLLNKTAYEYSKKTNLIKSMLIPIDAKLIRQEIHPTMRGKTRRQKRASPIKESTPKISIKKYGPHSFVERKKHSQTAHQRYKKTMRQERLHRVEEVVRKRYSKLPIYHPVVKVLLEERRLRPKSRSRTRHPSPEGSYSPTRPIGDFKILYEGTVNTEGMKPFGMYGKLPAVRRGTIRRARIHNNNNE